VAEGCEKVRMVVRTRAGVPVDGTENVADSRLCTTCNACLDGPVTIEVTTASMVSKGIFCSYECHEKWEMKKNA